MIILEGKIKKSITIVSNIQEILSMKTAKKDSIIVISPKKDILQISVKIEK